MIKTIKEIHAKDICMFKIGTFYHTYNRDSYILSYIFGYKIKELGANHKECGFPEIALPRVLLNQKINYIVLDREIIMMQMQSKIIKNKTIMKKYTKKQI